MSLGDPLEGHKFAQPLWTHDPQGFALQAGRERDEINKRGFRIYRSHFSFDLENWVSANPRCINDRDQRTCGILHMTWLFCGWKLSFENCLAREEW